MSTATEPTYAPVVWRRYQLRQPQARHAGTRLLAYRLDTRVILVYPDAQEPEETMVQEGAVGDYVAVLVEGPALTRFGSAFFVIPEAKFERAWTPEVPHE